MRFIETMCPSCGNITAKPAQAINRSRRIGAPIYCSRECAGIARRCHKTKAQRIEEKRLYDIEYRRVHQGLLKTKKAERHRRTYDPVKAARERKKRMPRHIEYCRKPKYKRWKSEYDRKYRALKSFGPFAEAFLLLTELDKRISERISDYEARKENGTLAKIQQRRRQDYADTGRCGYKTADGQ